MLFFNKLENSLLNDILLANLLFYFLLDFFVDSWNTQENGRSGLFKVKLDVSPKGIGLAKIDAIAKVK